MLEIQYDEFREDIIGPEGSVFMSDVLFIRAHYGEWIFHCPIFEETEQAKEDVRKILRGKIFHEFAKVVKAEGQLRRRFPDE